MTPLNTVVIVLYTGLQLREASNNLAPPKVFTVIVYFCPQTYLLRLKYFLPYTTACFLVAALTTVCGVFF